MRSSPRHGLSTCALTAGLAFAGCVAEPDVPPDQTGETTQAVFGTSWSWGTLDGTDLDIGPDDNQICFLRGIHGTLRGWEIVGGTEYLTSAGVYRRSGRYKIETYGLFGISAQVSCIPLTASSNREHIFVAQATHPEEFVADGPDRHCMLTSVSSSQDGWTTFPDGPPGVRLTKDKLNGIVRWAFREHLNPPGRLSDLRSSGGAEAVCFTYPSNGLVDLERHGNNANNTPSTGVLFHDEGGWMCGLTGLFGVFLDDWNQPGAEVFRSAAGDWRFEIKANGSLYTRCIR